MRSKEIRPGLEEATTGELLGGKPAATPKASTTSSSRTSTTKNQITSTRGTSTDTKAPAISGEVEKVDVDTNNTLAVSLSVPIPTLKVGSFYQVTFTNGFLLFEIVGFRTSGTWNINTECDPMVSGVWAGGYQYLVMAYPESTLRSTYNLSLARRLLWIDERSFQLKTSAKEVNYLGKKLEIPTTETPLELTLQ